MIHLQTLRRTGEAVLYAVLAGVGLAAALVGSRYGVFVEGGRVGPGFLPVVAGLLTALLCGSVALSSTRAAVRAEAGEAGGAVPDPAETDDVDVTGRTERQRVVNLWTVFGLTLVTILLVQVIGFLVAFGLLVLVIGAVVERQSVGRSVAIAVVAVAVVYAVFGLFLSVPLPGGLLGLGTEG